MQKCLRKVSSFWADLKCLFKSLQLIMWASIKHINFGQKSVSLCARVKRQRETLKILFPHKKVFLSLINTDNSKQKHSVLPARGLSLLWVLSVVCMSSLPRHHILVDKAAPHAHTHTHSWMVCLRF